MMEHITSKIGIPKKCIFGDSLLILKSDNVQLNDRSIKRRQIEAPKMPFPF